MPPSSSAYTPWDNVPHILAKTLCGLTLCLLFVGAMVTSTNSGLSVPDWPTTFGHNMYAFPLSKMKGGIFYEHGHRLFASAIGMLTILLVLATWMWESRKWVKGLTLTALLLVCLQGLLGGLTVRYKLPVSISSAHAGLAELFFCSMIWLTWATSADWKKKPAWRKNSIAVSALLLMALVYVQIIVGAVMRHSYAGLAIPTFPKAFGEWIPSFWSQGIALNFAHTRIGAFIITTGCLLLVASLLRQRELKYSVALFAVLAVQVTLGILTIWTGKIPWVASLHLAVGALLLGTLFSIGLWSGKQKSVVVA